VLILGGMRVCLSPAQPLPLVFRATVVLIATLDRPCLLRLIR
jgi:hypothetical protein